MRLRRYLSAKRGSRPQRGRPRARSSPLPLLLLVHRDRDPAVVAGGGIDVVGDAERVVVAVGAVQPAVPLVVEEERAHRRRRHLPLREVDVAAPAGLVAPPERGEDGVAGHQARERVDDRHAEVRGTLPGVALDRVEPCERADDLPVGVDAAVRPPLPRRRGGDHDEVGPVGAQRSVVDAQLGDGARRPVLGHHVRRPHQVAQPLAPLVGLQVDGNALGVAQEVVQPEVAVGVFDAVHERRDAAQRLQPLPRIDLDDLRAHVGQEVGHGGADPVPAQVEDAQPREREAAVAVGRRAGHQMTPARRSAGSSARSRPSMPQ